MIQQMTTFADVTKENIKQGSGGSGSGKTNSLFNLIDQQTDIDKIYKK